jgi:hypothetical protein
MKNISRLVFVAVVAVIVGAVAFLSSRGIPSPMTTIEKVMPDERFTL